MGELVSFNPIM